MTLEFQLGLIGWEATGSAIVTAFRQAGDQVDVDVDYQLTTLAGAQAVRAQILGYVEAGRTPVLPLQWASDATFTGYYRLTAASVPTDLGLINANRVQAQYRLERIQSYSAPAVESVLYGAKKTFAAAYTGLHLPWIGYPSSWSAFDVQVADTSVLDITNNRDLTGSLSMWIAAYTGFYDGVVLQAAPAAHFYDGAVLLRTGAALNVHTGRQIVSDPTAWSIDNGLVKIRQAGRSTSMFDIVTRKADGSDWSPRAKGMVVRYSYSGGTGIEWGAQIAGGAGVESVPQRVTVVKNTPEEVIVCLTYSVSTAVSPGAMCILRVYIGLRRGSRYATVSVASSLVTTWGLGYDAAAGFTGVGVTFNNASGSSNVGIKEPTADTYGQKSFVLRGSANMALGTSGQAYQTTADTTAEWGVGAIPGGADPSDTDTFIAAQFLAAQGETLRVVGQ